MASGGGRGGGGQRALGYQRDVLRHHHLFHKTPQRREGRAWGISNQQQQGCDKDKALSRTNLPLKFRASGSVCLG